MSTLGGKVFASVGRIIIFKECLKNNIIPFIILDKDKCKNMGEKALTVATDGVENKIYAQIIETIKLNERKKNV